MISHAGMDLDACRGLEFELYVKEQIQGVDQAAVIADLAAGMEGYDPETYFQHFSLLDYDHLQIARDAVGRCCALLGTTESACCGEPFLFLLTGFVANREQGKGLMRRMIARTMVALSTTGFHPSVLAARTYNPVWYRMLEGLGGLMRGAVLYPRPAPADQDPDLTQLAAELAMRTNPGMPFDTQLGILRGGLAKTPTLFRGRRPRSGSDPVDELFHSKLGEIDLVVTLLDLRHVPMATRQAALSSLLPA